MALSADQNDVYFNGIQFYDVDDGSNASCSVGGSGGGTGEFPNNQVKTFASEPVTSTWNISNSTVEQWFLKQGGAQPVIARYGLNSSNIGQITSAVEAANVSPVFFYLYTVNEGGAGGANDGFINHTDRSGLSGVEAATADAQYISTQSKVMDSHPSWVDAGNPVDFVPQDVKDAGDADFKNMPSGSIGRVYIPATAAATWEVYYPNGLKKEFNKVQDYGAPLSEAMHNIEAMGGDPSQGGTTISNGGCNSDGGSGTCSATKPFGGVSATQDSPQYTQEQLVQLFGDPGTASSHPAMTANLTTVDFNGNSVQVNKKAAGCLAAVAQQIASENINYTINDMGCYRFDSDNGTSNIGLASYHTYGVACDINPSTNPFSESGANVPHDMPQAYVQAFYDHGWSWGGNWHQPKDFMHFEFNGIDPSGS
ncbi:MAG TPA: M15 family metallopeptidase [Candidatus Saccharimonadales bacterium]|nr:M15 family metallopeptidase [Candidatus Saccharimonadales bacterium]